jgi:hypothetical protein
LVFRFNQCIRKYIDTKDRWPHLANASKYALSQTVTLFGAFHPIYLEHKRRDDGGHNLFQFFWMLIFISSSLYSFTWDVKMDWGLGRREYGFLGDSLMFHRRVNYYTVIALDAGKRNMECSCLLYSALSWILLTSISFSMSQYCDSCGCLHLCPHNQVLPLRYPSIYQH